MLLICFSISLFISCIGEAGYPSKVVLPKNGGEKYIFGEETLISISVGYEFDKYVEHSYYQPQDSANVKLDWLEVKAMKGENKVKLIAQPNRTGKKRVLHLFISAGSDDSEVKIIQNK